MTLFAQQTWKSHALLKFPSSNHWVHFIYSSHFLNLLQIKINLLYAEQGLVTLSHTKTYRRELKLNNSAILTYASLLMMMWEHAEDHIYLSVLMDHQHSSKISFDKRKSTKNNGMTMFYEGFKNFCTTVSAKENGFFCIMWQYKSCYW